MYDKFSESSFDNLLYRLILDKSYCIEFFLDKEGNLKYLSPSCERVTGISSKQFLENPSLLINIIHPDDRGKFEEHLSFIRNVEKDHEFEFRVFHADGSTRWISHHSSPMYDDQGRYIGIRGTNIDITKQKQIQTEIISKEKDLEMLFNSSSDGFFYMMIDEPIRWDDTVDKDSVMEYVLDHQRITKMNRSMLDQYGATEEEFVGLTVRELFPHDIEHGKSVWKEFFDKGVLYVETSEKKLTGEPIYIEGEYLCIYDDDGRIIGHFGIQRDVTERKRTAEQLSHLNNRLKEEISKAAEIHNRLFPIELPDLLGFDFEAYYQAAMKLGGDYYDFIYYKDKVFIVLVDVSGHGLDGAMIATFIKSCIINWIATVDEDKISLKEGLEFIAKQFNDIGYPDDYFACLFLGLLDPASSTLTYSTTGFHTKMMISRSKELIELPLGGLPISGALPIELLNTTAKDQKLDSGDVLLVSTDGLMESIKHGQQYGQRFIEILENNPYAGAKELKNLIVSDFKSFIKEDDLHDDVTFLIIKSTN